MTQGEPEDAADDVRRALSLLEAFRARQREGSAEGLDDFLRANESLRTVLETLLAAEALKQNPSEPSGSFANFLLPRPGHDFGPYHLEERIGHGASGTVFLAIDTKLGRRVALKILHPELLADRRGRDRFWREIRAASVLDHPNICAIYDSGVVGQVPFLSMRYVAGETLAARIVKARDARLRMVGFGGAEPGRAGTTPALGRTPMTAELTPGSRSSIEALLLRFEQLALALHYVHQQGFVHRDVKPANVMLDEGDVPVLLDFGLARTTVGASSMGPVADAGTPMYLAPEQVAGTSAPGPAADVYALGITLYECATLRHPFEGTTQNELYDAILHRTPVPARQWNAKLPRDLQVVLAKATDKDPGRRYVSALAFAEDLRRIRQFQPILARPVSRAVRVERWMRRNPLAAAFLGVATVATVVSLLLLIAFVRDRERIELQATRALLEVAEAEARTLLPAFSDKLPALRRFLARFDGTESLEERRRRVGEAKAVLERKAWPATPADRIASRRYREQLERIENLRRESTIDWTEKFGFVAKLVSITAELMKSHMLLFTTAKARMLFSLVPTMQRRQDQLKAQVKQLEAELGLVGALTFESAELGREHDVLSRLEADLAAACADGGLLPRMRIALAHAEQSQAHLEEHRDAWTRVRQEMRATPLYKGFEVEPQEGLVPLGRDAEGGLQIFWHPASGARPEVVDGKVRLREDSGMVFVLAPPGSFQMGLKDHYRLHEVTLDAFFVSKYEVTQGQWHRLGGRRPSMIGAGQPVGGVAITDLHPVESVSCIDAQRLLSEFGMDLPTEAQWEYVARAGTTTETWLGTADEMVELANSWIGRVGFVWSHAPVDSIRPNPWGLYYVLGNVAEMCRDHNVSYEVAPHAPGDGLLLSFLSYDGASRGGSIADGSEVYRTGRRFWHIRFLATPLHGVRAVRPLLPKRDAR